MYEYVSVVFRSKKFAFSRRTKQEAPPFKTYFSGNSRNANKEHVTLDISYFALSYIVLISVVIRFFREVRLLKNPQGENVGGKIQQIQDNL